MKYHAFVTLRCEIRPTMGECKILMIPNLKLDFYILKEKFGEKKNLPVARDAIPVGYNWAAHEDGECTGRGCCAS